MKSLLNTSGLGTSFNKSQLINSNMMEDEEGKENLSLNDQNTSASTLLHKTPTLVLRQFSGKTYMDFGRVKMNSPNPHVMNLCVSNPTQKEQEIAVEKLPVQFGFTLREVMYRIPPMTDFAIPITWQPTQPGKVNCQLVFLWNTRFRFPIVLFGEALPPPTTATKKPNLVYNRIKSAMNTTQAIQPTPNTSSLAKLDTTFNAATCNISAILPSNDTSFTSTATTRRTQPITKTLATSTSSLHSRIQKPEKMKKDNRLALGQPRSMPNVSVLSSSAMSQTQKRIIQSTARSEIQKIIEKQKELEKSLPVSMSQLVHELKNFGIGIHQISLIQGYKDIRVAMLLQWMQAVLSRYEELPSKYRVWSFSAPALKTEEEMIFNLITNQYRTPFPIPLSELLPREENREVLKNVCYGDNGTWSASFSPTKIQKTTGELDKDFDEHQMVCKVAHLFNQLYHHKENIQRLKALAVIQNWLLSIYWKRRLCKLREYSTITQARMRAESARRELEQLKEQRRQYFTYQLTLRVQAVCRGSLARREREFEVDKLVTVQARIRSVLIQRKNEEMTRAAIKIQATARMWMAKEAYLDDRYDVIMCQSVIRGFLNRQRFYNEYTEVLEYQNMLELEDFENFLDTELNSYDDDVTSFQAVARGFLEQINRNKMETAVRKIQATVRMHQQRCRFKSSMNDITSVQALIRRHLDTEKLATEKNRIETCQSLVRGYFDRANVLVEMDGILTVQAQVRRRLEEISNVKSINRITIMQNLMRRFVNECDSLQDRYNVYILQALGSGYVDRRNKKETIHKVILCQSAVRGFLGRRNRQHQMESIVTIQRCMKNYLQRKRYNQFVDIVTMAQSRIRSYFVEKQKQGAIQEITFLQAAIRGKLYRDALDNVVEKTTTVQSTMRALEERQTVMTQYQRIQSMQSLIRSRSCRETLLDDLYDITISQSIIKGHICRESMWNDMVESMRCQAVVRGYNTRVEQAYQIDCVTRIQSALRTFKQTEAVKDDLYDIQLSQSIIRGFMERRKLEKEKQNIVNFQTLARGFVCTRFMESIKNTTDEMHKSATKIQKIFRGFKVRKSNAKQVNSIRQRIMELALDTDERKKLKYRTQRALEVLLKSNSVNQVMSACANLAVTTKWSDNCCESLVTNNAVPILYSFIKMLNRSKPHMELLIHILDILLHLTRIKYLNCLVHEKNDYFDILFDQLQIYKEKDDIFMRVLTLIRRADTKRLKGVKESLGKRCTSLAKLMERKYSMEKKTAQARQNLNASMNCSSLNISLSTSTLGSKKPNVNRSGVGYSVSSLVVTYENLLDFISYINNLN